MKCPLCEYPYLKKARLDVYLCYRCKVAWLIHKLSSYKTFEEASKLSDDEYMKHTHLQNIIGHYDNCDKIVFPLKDDKDEG